MLMDIWVIVQAAAVCMGDVRGRTSAYFCAATCLAGSPTVPSLTLWQEAMFSSAKKSRFTMLI